jgi:hypothetical protein
VRELSHRAHDRRDTVDPVEGALERGRDPVGQVVEIRLLFGGRGAALALCLIEEIGPLLLR